MKQKRGNAVWYNISFHCNVCTFPELTYIFAAINVFTWKLKEAVVFDIVFSRIV